MSTQATHAHAHDMTRLDTARHDTTRHDTTRHDTTRHNTPRHATSSAPLMCLMPLVMTSHAYDDRGDHNMSSHVMPYLVWHAPHRAPAAVPYR